MAEVKEAGGPDAAAIEAQRRAAAEAAAKQQAERAAAQAAEKMKAAMPQVPPKSAEALKGTNGVDGFDAAKPKAKAIDDSKLNVKLGESPQLDVTRTLGKQVTTPTKLGEQVTKLTGGVNLKVDKDSVNATASGQLGFSQDLKNTKGYGVKFGVTTDASLAANVRQKDGVTAFTLTGQASVKVEGGVTTPIGGLNGSLKKGVEGKFEVSMPTAEFDKLKADPSKFNPLDPATYPPGTKVRMDASNFKETELGGTFRGFAADTKTKESQGQSVELEKLPDGKVRLTTGPTEAFSKTDKFGVDLGVAKAKVGRTDSLDGAQLKSADFDLKTDEGRAAFNRTLLTGEIPKREEPGVTNPRSIDKLNYDSKTIGEASLGPLSLSGEGPKNTGEKTVITNADGTKDVTSSVQYGDNPKLTIQQKFDKDGKELEDQRRYTFTVTPDKNSVELYNAALNGDASKTDGPLKAGQPSEITFTKAQLDEVQAREQQRLRENPLAQSPWVSRDARNQPIPQKSDDFAVGLARNGYGGQYGFAEHLFNNVVPPQGDRFPALKAATKPVS